MEVLKNKKRKVGTYRLFLIFGVIVILSLLVFVFFNQPLKPILVMTKADDRVKVDSSLEIQFDWPVARNVNITITPEVTGELTYKNMILDKHLSRTVVFTPELNFWPDTTYKVTVTNVETVLPSLLPARSYGFTFTTESLPTIKSVTPSTSTEIAPDTSFKVALDKKPDLLAEYEFVFFPEVSADIKLDEDRKVYTIQPQNLLSHGQIYRLEVIRKEIRNYYQKQEVGFTGEGESVWQGDFTVRQAPLIESITPSGESVGLNEQIKIVFSEKISLSAFQDKVSLTPALAGTWQTDDGKIFTYNSSAFASDTSYTVKISQGLKTEDSGYFTEDIIHTFATDAPVRLLRSSPASGSHGVSIESGIRLTFNQPVDSSSAHSHFSILPAIDGSFSWQGNTLIFKPTASLSFNAVYSVTLSAGIKSLSGFDSTADIKLAFTTELSVTKLAASYHHQEHNLSCEAAALLMGLLYRGVNVNETALINAIGFDPTPKSNGVWGDPNVAFVGDINGHQPSTGYGVYWGPVAKAANLYRPARVITGGKITDLTAEILKGNPVVVWGTAGSGTRIDWKNKSGQNIVAINGEHARLVIGFIGSADNPTKIITLDPLAGERYFTVSSFLWNWGLLGSSGVVVE